MNKSEIKKALRDPEVKKQVQEITDRVLMREIKYFAGLNGIEIKALRDGWYLVKRVEPVRKMYTFNGHIFWTAAEVKEAFTARGN